MRINYNFTKHKGKTWWQIYFCLLLLFMYAVTTQEISGKKEEKTRLLDEITTTQSFKLSIGETVVMEKHFHSYLKNYVWNITPSSNFDFIWFDGWCFNNWWMSVEMCYQSRDKNFICSNYIPLKCWRVVTLLFSFL